MKAVPTIRGAGPLSWPEIKQMWHTRNEVPMAVVTDSKSEYRREIRVVVVSPTSHRVLLFEISPKTPAVVIARQAYEAFGGTEPMHMPAMALRRDDGMILKGDLSLWEEGDRFELVPQGGGF